MKNMDRKHPFIIRIALLIAALSVQLICAIGLPYGSHGILLHALRCLEFAIALLLVYACYHVLKNHMYLYICVILDCIGILVSFFSYQRFITGYASSNLDKLQKLLIGPYLILSMLAWAIWFASKYTDWRISKKMQFMFSAYKSNMQRILGYLLTALSIAFLFAGVYLFALESFLLGSWAILTCCLMLFAVHKGKT